MTDAIVSINGAGMQSLEILTLITLIMLLPSILIMMTCFTRIVIVLSLLRNAMGLQQTPPNTVIIGIALFLSLFIMQPVISDINTNAYEPYKADTISQQQALDNATVPIKQFMLKQTKVESLNVFLNFADMKRPSNLMEIPMHVVIPAFMTSELNRAFLMGFLLYIPFLVIDMIVASVLMSMGMVMLPPSMISMPFKLLLFVVVNGWELLFSTMVSSFN
ncbi:MAG: flagellar type III secretion system pore protein FliP [Aminipila sp.]